MSKGTVKWFLNTKGYGFVESEKSGEDIFVHFSVINMEGFKTLKHGETVEFESSTGPKGLYATKVIKLEDTNDKALSNNMPC